MAKLRGHSLGRQDIPESHFSREFGDVMSLGGQRLLDKRYSICHEIELVTRASGGLITSSSVVVGLL